MARHCIQHVREQLQRRLDRLRQSSPKSFHWTLRRLVAFLQENEITAGILTDLIRRYPDAPQRVLKSPNGELMSAESDTQHAAFCYAVITECSKKPMPALERSIGQYITDSSKESDQDAAFRFDVVESLFGYLQEQIDNNHMMLALLNKYKKRCEWFRRQELLKKCDRDTRKGEKALLDDVCEYLHEQGIEFHIEPKSASGRIDLISEQTGPDRLAAEAKIFSARKGQDRQSVIRGFRQLYDYTKDFNETFGYLVVFKTCEEDLSIRMEPHEAGVPFIPVNSKTIFVLVINICDYPKPASKRGKLKKYEITKEQFAEAIGCHR
jgi:hypothetical protein